MHNCGFRHSLKFLGAKWEVLSEANSESNNVKTGLFCYFYKGFWSSILFSLKYSVIPIFKLYVYSSYPSL